MANDRGGSTEALRPNASLEALSVDAVFDILANQRRRYVLHCLQRYEDPMAVADIADKIAMWEHETDITEISEEEVKSVSTSLDHTHIPKLVDADVVEYDQERDVVALSEDADELIPVLEFATE